MNLEGLPYAVAPMELEDVPTVSQVEQVVFTLPWSATAFDYELRYNPASEYLVLRYLPWAGKSWAERVLPRRFAQLLPRPRTDPSLLGYGGFWISPEEAHICTLALRPEWRGRSLGELLLTSLLERAHEGKAPVVTLEVRVTNTAAQKLYVKYGFKQTKRRKHYYSDNGEDALVMTSPPMASAAYQEHLAGLRELLRRRLLDAVQSA